jgi:hypothetical protein
VRSATYAAPKGAPFTETMYPRARFAAPAAVEEKPQYRPTSQEKTK